jgi:hypothetical protein
MFYNYQHYLESVCNTCLLIWESRGFLLTKLVSSSSESYGKSLVLAFLFSLLLTFSSS